MSFTPETGWTCGRCGRELEPAMREIEYLGSTFQVELLACEECGLTFVPEDLALGRMHEVEMLLEDK